MHNTITAKALALSFEYLLGMNTTAVDITPVCAHLQKDGSAGKVNEVSEHVAKEMDKACSCDLSAKYIGDNRLLCDSTSSSRVVYQARMISTNSVNSSGLLHLLADWAQTEPLVVVQGVQLMVSSRCSVALKALGDTTCTELKAPPTLPTPSPKNPDKPDSQETSTQDESGGSEGSPIIPVIAGVVGVLVLLIVVICVVVVAVTCLKRRTKPRRPTMQRYINWFVVVAIHKYSYITMYIIS